MWKNAAAGRFKPIATIIIPNWLVVEKAIIFLISFCVIAQDAAKNAVIAPSKRAAWAICGFKVNIGEMRISRNIPATTIVEL